MTTIEIVLWVLKIISYVVTAVFGLFGIYEFFAGPEGAARMLKKLNIPLSYVQVLVIGFSFLALLFVSSFLLDKLSGKL